ncbi:TPA: hypothetical protein J1X87_004618 [Escherichia coli]|nr:hypothetical protein [Escherichia coli]
MKKTLISLAVAASAIASGSAMAWQATGRGGTVELSGTLTPVELITPWEVKTGAAVSGLDTQIKKSQKGAVITLRDPIPVLAIRTLTSSKSFHGDVGLAPQIDFHDNADFEHATTGVSTLSLEVKDNKSGEKIGTMTTNILAGAMTSSSKEGTGFILASKPGHAFYGGLAPSISVPPHDVITGLLQIFGSELMANFDEQSAQSRAPASETFADKHTTYSGFYGAGIEDGQLIKISLDRSVEGDEAINWHASLPVTVSYQ